MARWESEVNMLEKELGQQPEAHRGQPWTYATLPQHVHSFKLPCFLSLPQSVSYPLLYICVSRDKFHKMCFKKSILQRVFYRKYFAESISQRVFHREYFAESISHNISHKKYHSRVRSKRYVIMLSVCPRLAPRGNI